MVYRLEPPRPGLFLDHRFQLVRPIARGRTSEVWTAQDHQRGKEVAVKHLASHLLGRDDARALIRAEARLLDKMHHAHVAELLWYAPERSYFVMPRYEAITLRSAMEGLAKSRRRLPVTLVLDPFFVAAHGEANDHVVEREREFEVWRRVLDHG